MIVKFYSKRCRACLRIAAKYRRLALKYKDEVQCYEVEQHTAGRAMIEALSVERVPSLQIYCGTGVSRLASVTCQPNDFKAVEALVKE